MRIGKKLLVITIMAGLVALTLNAWDVGATSISRHTITQAGNVNTVDVTPAGRYSCYSVCPPAVETVARAVDYATGDYFEATWTIIHNTNMDGQVVVYDLTASGDTASAITDSLSIRLIAGMTYGGEEIVGDSIVVWIWDVDDTCYLFGRGTYPVERDWQGD